jgi:hypothetical protein
MMKNEKRYTDYTSVLKELFPERTQTTLVSDGARTVSTSIGNMQY